MNPDDNKRWWYPLPAMVAAGVLLFYAGVLDWFGISLSEIRINQFSNIVLFTALSLGITGFLFTESNEHKTDRLLHRLLWVSSTLTSMLSSYVTTVCMNLLS